MSDDLAKICKCGCIYLEAECPDCNKVTDADRIEELEAKLGRAEALYEAAKHDAQEAEAYAEELENKLYDMAQNELKGQN